MAKLIPKNEATLRAIMKLGNATLHDVEAIVGVVAKEAINSLVRCAFIYVVETKSQETKKGYMRGMHVYAITDRGRQKLQDVDFPPARQMLALKVSKNQELHQMQHFVIPTLDPNVREMMAEIGGREVKITYGVHHAYDSYVPPIDHSRNYTPRPIKGIHSL